jgi:uncharacterized membrane protein YadS
LLPAVIGIGYVFGKGAKSDDNRPALIPWFLMAFVALVIINSFGGFSAQVASALGSLSRAALLTAVAALGVRTSLQELTSVGVRPLLALTLQTLLLAVFIFLCLILATN